VVQCASIKSQEVKTLANIKSQIKRVRQSEKQHLRNKSAKSALKTLISKFETALEAKDKKAAEEMLKSAIQALDKAVSRGAIHPNNAANKKSRLMRKFNALLQEAPEEARPAKKPKTTKTSKSTKTKSAKSKKTAKSSKSTKSRPAKGGTKKTPKTSKKTKTA